MFGSTTQLAGWRISNPSKVRRQFVSYFGAYSFTQPKAAILARRDELSVKLPVMPITVFEMHCIPSHRRECIEATVVKGGKHTTEPYEAWVTADPVPGRFKVLITGPHGFERMVMCTFDDAPAVIAEQVRQTVED
jgi:hypothetical protein